MACSQRGGIRWLGSREREVCPLSAGAFTPESTRQAVEDACLTSELDGRGARLVRLGENALYHLPESGVMARVSRSADTARREVGVATWLAGQAFPAVRLIDDRTQPVVASSGVVTFWAYIDEDPEDPPTSADLGGLLRRLHELPPPDVELPEFDPMPKLDSRLSNPVLKECLSASDRDFLRERRSQLAHEFAALEFVLDRGHIHGDAHRHNLMRPRGERTCRLIDLEDFAIGPREWDLCVEAIGYSRFGWITQEDYRAYVQAIGFDPLDWSGFEVIRAIRELNMTSWLAQRLGESPEVDAEVKQRICDLRDDKAPRNWAAF